MAETTDNKPLNSREMRKFYRTLAAVHTNAIFLVLSAEDEEQMNARADTITQKLVKFAYVNFPGKCDNGEVWNPITKKCELT